MKTTLKLSLGTLGLSALFSVAALAQSFHLDSRNVEEKFGSFQRNKDISQRAEIPNMGMTPVHAQLMAARTPVLNTQTPAFQRGGGHHQIKRTQNTDFDN